VVVDCVAVVVNGSCIDSHSGNETELIDIDGVKWKKNLIGKELSSSA